MPEVFGDAILVNGKLFPYLEVEPRKYRFRVLNGANGRFFHLTLSNENTSTTDPQRADVGRSKLSSNRHRSGTAVGARAAEALVHRARGARRLGR